MIRIVLNTLLILFLISILAYFYLDTKQRPWIRKQLLPGIIAFIIVIISHVIIISWMSTVWLTKING